LKNHTGDQYKTYAAIKGIIKTAVHLSFWFFINDAGIENNNDTMITSVAPDSMESESMKSRMSIPFPEPEENVYISA